MKTATQRSRRELLRGASPAALWALTGPGRCAGAFALVGALLAIPLVDTIRFWNELPGRQLDAALTLILASPFEINWSLLLVAPLLLAIVSILGTASLRWSERNRLAHDLISRRSPMWTVMLAVAVVAFAAWTVLLDRMEVASGFRFVPSMGYDFESITLEVVDWTGRGLTAALGILFAIALNNVGKEEPRIGFSRLLNSARQAQITRLLRPRFRFRWTPLQLSSSSTPLRAVQRAYRPILKRYHQLGPGGEKSKTFLLQNVEIARLRLRDLLGLDPLDGDVIRMVGQGASDALNTVLAEWRDVKTLLVAPFEHPASVAVADFRAHTAGLKVIHLMSPTDLATFAGNWEQLERQLVDRIVEAVLAADKVQERAGILMSGVWYATGHVIPVQKVIESVMNKLPRKLTDSRRVPRFIIDHSHGPGNAFENFQLGAAQAMLFSSSKWLLSDQSVGIVVMKRHATNPNVRAYNAVDRELTPGRVNHQAIFDLVASTAVLASIPARERFERSNALRSMLEARLQGEWEAVCDNLQLPHTAMLTLRAASDPGRLLSVEQLEELLAEKGITATAFELEPGRPWLRLCLPFFLDKSDIDRLVKALRLL